MAVLRLAVLPAIICVALSLVTDSNEYIMFIGNPGVGKSTLLNSFFQEAVFKSGPSPGSGMTQEFSVKPLPLNGRVVNLVDSPGLADADTRQKCAQEIEKGLKQGGMYKIVIMVRQQDGRVVDEDKTTLKLILDALPKIKDNQFGILVNQVPSKMLKKFDDPKSEFKEKFVVSLLSGLSKKTKFIRMIKSDEDLQSEFNVFFAPDSQGFKSTLLLLDDIVAADIAKKDVQKVRANEWDKEKEKYTKMLAKLEKDADHARNETAKHQATIERLETNQKKTNEEFEKLRKRNDDLQKQVNDKKSSPWGKIIGGILAPFTGGLSLAAGALIDEL